MAKFYGKVGFVTTEDSGDGIWLPKTVERSYYGDVTRNTRRLDRIETSTNDDVNVNNTISIVADAYSKNNFFAIRYVAWMGTRWKVTDVEVDPDRPRLNLTVGGVYNGPEATDQ